MNKLEYYVFSKKNTKGEDKPNEDLAIFDEKQNLGLILDGVSRDRENGLYPNPSPALRATEIFLETVLSAGLSDDVTGISKIEKLILAGNSKLKSYNEKLNNRFLAGTVGIVFSIEGGYFNYGYIGDSYGGFIRENKMRIFTECQTKSVIESKSKYTTNEIRYDICNHINHPMGYGVWDGSSAAMDFVKYGTIRLCDEDVLYLFTDGLINEVRSIPVSELIRTTPFELFDGISCENMDDRTCIKIVVGE